MSKTSSQSYANMLTRFWRTTTPWLPWVGSSCRKNDAQMVGRGSCCQGIVKRIGEKNAYTRKLASPAQVEKIVKKGDLKLTKRVFDAKLKPLIIQIDSGGTNMVKEGNSKTGIEPIQNIPQLTGPSILNPKQ